MASSHALIQVALLGLSSTQTLYYLNHKYSYASCQVIVLLHYLEDISKSNKSSNI
jgi:hypothetical protein